MTMQELIQQGWAEHDSKTAEVADRLESSLELVVDGAGAAQFMNLAIHAVGDHLGDRGRARRLCEAALARAGDEPGPAPWLYAAVARHLDGDKEAATEAEARLGQNAAAPVRVGMLVAQGRMHGGDWPEAAALYAEALHASEALPEGHAGERATAIVSNNIASELLNLDPRDEDQDALMAKAANASKVFWARVGTWVNEERGDYLLALVHNALRRPQEGRAFAEQGLAIIAAHGADEEKVDQAFLHLARAQACRDGGDRDAYAESLAKAEALAADFEGEGLVSWFQEELAKAR